MTQFRDLHVKNQDFESALRELLRGDPFQPFEVQINDGRTIIVDEPAVAFGGGRAGFIGADELVEFFDSDSVVAFRTANQELAS
jgi:hypothetical protein